MNRFEYVNNQFNEEEIHNTVMQQKSPTYDFIGHKYREMLRIAYQLEQSSVSKHALVTKLVEVARAKPFAHSPEANE